MSLPSFYEDFRRKRPEVVAAYEALGDATRAAGRERELHQLGLLGRQGAGARLEGAVHSHARRALEAGATAEELRHLPLLAITTLGFPAAMATRALIEDVLAPAGAEGESRSR
jgi:4-carboxymuconolactone decarboxylase